jgi:two-component system C4-dicarboxylate transport sensor histidine kinase DctB
MLKQILQNLVRNALDAIADRPDGRVTVAVQSEAGTVVVTIDDNGPGIAIAQREKVFEAFFTTRSFGSGLGLPTARKLASALGAELRLSESDSGGARAVLKMPAQLQEHTSREPAWN